ncbi:MAG: hypothetical protein NC548_25165 [Lachnospiraceae bacterium]|nr:hypothetical protein [Lachnospiraceae bacterium]
MDAWSMMENLSDMSMKQLVFFYELCKAGVVRFDMSNPAHAGLLEKLSIMMHKEVEAEAHTRLEKAKKEARHKAYMAILCQILAHIMPAERKGIRKVG